MKTNEWLAYFMEQHRADLGAWLAERAGESGGAAAGEAVAAALERDFADEVCDEGPEALRALAGPDSAALWPGIERQIGDYIANEEDLSGGARRMAYLRLSDYAAQIKAALREN